MVAIILLNVTVLALDSILAKCFHRIIYKLYLGSESLLYCHNVYLYVVAQLNSCDFKMLIMNFFRYGGS